MDMRSKSDVDQLLSSCPFIPVGNYIYRNPPLRGIYMIVADLVGFLDNEF